MRLAYITDYDSLSRRNWSGTGYYIRRALEESGCEIAAFECSNSAVEEAMLKLRTRLFHRLDRRLYMSFHDPWRAWFRSRRTRRWLNRQSGIDWVFSPGTLQTAFLSTRLPMASWSDATFHSLSSTYPDYKELSNRGRRHGNRVEQAFLARCTRVFFASDWAADDALDYYHASLEKVCVVPFGANFDEVPSLEELMAKQRNRFKEREFLFVGVDWARKGGDFVLEVLERLVDLSDKPLRLSIVGAEPPAAVLNKNWVTYHGFISKDNDDGRRKMAELFSRAFALFVPSLAECYGLVYCEAFGFACPAFARNVGGVSTIIENGRTGLLFHAEDSAVSCADKIQKLLNDERAYSSMCRHAREGFESTFNWKVAGRSVVAVLAEAEGKEGGSLPG
jgi:glycosyltransferase involved in cell wall biosynthesis